jgi:hypothetical protein
VPGLADDEGRAYAHHALRLAQDPFDAARVALVAGDLERARRRLGVVESHDAPLDLRDRLLRHHDDIAVGELDVLGDERSEIVSFP